MKRNLAVVGKYSQEAPLPSEVIYQSIHAVESTDEGVAKKLKKAKQAIKLFLMNKGLIPIIDADYAVYECDGELVMCE